MRGRLRIASARVPYRRAGLVFASREPVEIDIRDLDGERLRAIAQDPALTIEMGNDDGSFDRTAFFSDVPVETMDLAIASIAETLPPREAPAAPEPVESREEMVIRLQRQADQIIDLTEQLARAKDDTAAVLADLAGAMRALDGAKAELKAATAKPATTAKPAAPKKSAAPAKPALAKD